MSQAIATDSLQLFNTGDTAEPGGRIEQIPVTASFEETMRVFERDGVVCLTEAFPLELIEDAVRVLDSHMDSTEMEHFFDTSKGSNLSNLGVLTKRRSEILAEAPELMAQLLIQPRFMEVTRARLNKISTSVLIHQVMGLEVHPGEVAQGLHRDNSIWPIPGERAPYGVGLMIPFEDFTPETGATRVILGSHLWPETRYIDPKDIESYLNKTGGKRWRAYSQPKTDPEMESIADVPLGSLFVWDGDLLHGGGANTTKNRVRKSLLNGYCVGWLRGETNQQLMWPPEVARSFPRELQRLVGYSVENGILGCIQLGEDPIGLLEAN